MAIVSKKVFLAPSAMVAFIDRGHQKHEEAAAFFRYFAENSYQLFSDNISVVNAYTSIYQQISPSLGKDFLRTMALSDINVINPEESDMKAALKALVAYQNTELTFPEALMSVLAVKRNISQIYTFDYLHALFGLGVFYPPI